VGTIERNRSSGITTKKQYIIGFKRFLHWYGKRYGKREYLDFADGLQIKYSPNTKLLSDLLTKEEILKMIDVADGPRDRAIITVLAESGVGLARESHK
jgi:integrase